MWEKCPNPACRGDVIACVRQCYHCGADLKWAEWVPVLEETIEVVTREAAQVSQLKAFELAGKVLEPDFRAAVLSRLRDTIPALLDQGRFRRSVSATVVEARRPRVVTPLRTPAPGESPQWIPVPLST